MSKASESSAYYQAVTASDEDLQHALDALCRREMAGQVTGAEAARERCALLEHHLERCQAARREHLGSTS